MNRKRNKTASLIAAEQSIERLLKKVGYVGKFVGSSIHEIPNYKIKSNLPKTSDIVCSSGPKKEENRYTGNEIMGIATMHKSNAVPVRKDSNDAIEISQMRRN